MSSSITDLRTKRILKDVKQIITCPLTDNGIYYHHQEEDITKGIAMIVGPADTPYFGGYYFFDLTYPVDYPFSPPVVKYMTNDGKTRFNPNLYKCGKVCVSILNTWSGEKWSACQTISSVLLTLCSILNDRPLLNEPGIDQNNPDFVPYQQSIEYVNIDFAICDAFNGINVKPPFTVFLPDMTQRMLDNADKILAFIRAQPKEKKTISVRIFSMNTITCYETLETKFLSLQRRLLARTAETGKDAGTGEGTETSDI